MSDTEGLAEHGIHITAARLAESLRSYIEAQYHIRNEAAIRERRALLEEEGAVCQVSFVESTPIFELDKTYNELRLPAPIKAILSALAQLDVGIFSRPYVHQARALESFFNTEAADLIVATG